MTCTSQPAFALQMKSCLETWAPECARLGIPVYFFDGERGERGESGKPENETLFPGVQLVRLAGVGQDYASASDKQWQGFLRLHQEAPADFYLIVGTDNYVWGENLLRLLRPYDPAQPWAISGFQQSRVFGRGEDWKEDPRYWCFPLGGAGVILSWGAMERMGEEMGGFNRAWREVAPPSLADACDLAFAYFAEKYRVPQVRDYPLYACSWLYRYKNPDYVNVGEIDYQAAAIFHYMEARDMRLYHILRSQAEEYICLRNVVARAKMMSAEGETLSPLYRAGLSYDFLSVQGLEPEQVAAVALGIVERKALLRSTEVDFSCSNQQEEKSRCRSKEVDFSCSNQQEEKSRCLSDDIDVREPGLLYCRENIPREATRLPQFLRVEEGSAPNRSGPLLLKEGKIIRVEEKES